MATINSPSQLNLLIVEDDEALAKLFVGIANKRRLRCTCATTIAEGKRILESGDVDLLLTDVRLPDGNGLDLIEWTKQTDPRILILAVTAFGNIEIAVRAVKQGAYDFLTKPVEPAVLGVALDRAVEACSLRGEVEALRGALATQNAMRGIIGKSAALHDILSLVRRVADSQATVLITGPSGSGKERVARALHDASKRKEKPFVAVNSAAIPEQLLESELFGYTKGAFTD
ncbi:MAG TPA: sigma 54-interacting transcriptional regulator, partial [Polyangium sp.]|nr:sigma 54-interacting transcriptional regulator [Polyangium sp.]